ncbi:LysE family translocator [Sulfurospirillum sp. T05]|uniref:LysE family translocator n=1 Tax=Sulfurospirillum tamanense TaxID=2813362 RepID=A0ABS2WSB3_9BACT|nr:LysE family translocator [Sulfurospirillum tamanensis]
MEFLAIFLAFIIPLAWTPGPVNITLAAMGTTNGFKQSLKLILGLNVAFMLQSLATGLGLARLFSLYPFSFIVIKSVGVAYLLYLAYKISQMKLQDKKIPLDFSNGFILSLLNPKVYMTLVLMFTQFKNQSETFGGIFFLSALAMSFFFVGNALWSLFGSSLRRFIANETVFVLQKYVFALLLCGVAVYMALH